MNKSTIIEFSQIRREIWLKPSGWKPGILVYTIEIDIETWGLLGHFRILTPLQFLPLWFYFFFLLKKKGGIKKKQK